MEDSVQELIAGCRKRHRQSQLAMYRRFAPLVYPICLRIVGHSEEAEEAMQDTFLKLFEKLDQYHDELCFEAWIRRIAVRTAIDYVRRRLPEEELIEETLPDVPDDEEELREQEEQTLLTVAPSGMRWRKCRLRPVWCCRFICLKATIWKKSPRS